MQQQPDLGTSLVLSLILISIIGLTRVKWKSAVYGVSIVSTVGVLMWNYGLKDYQRDVSRRS